MTTFLLQLTSKPHSLNRTQRTRGFTIIETLIAIAVLMIAIAGPLAVASRGLLSAQISKDQMVASYLAEESMEMIKNTRDNNISLSGASAWLNTPANLSSCVLNARCDYSAVDSFFLKTNCGTVSCPLYIDQNGLYHNTQVSNSQLSQFSRSMYFEAVSGGSVEKRVHVLVSWNEGTVPNQVEIMSEVTQITR